METAETDPVAAKPAAPKKKKTKKRARPTTAAPKAAAAEPSEFGGLTPEDCCAGCSAGCCLITRKPICGHPRKGGLQPPDMAIPETMARYQRAAKYLAHVAVERRE